MRLGFNGAPVLPAAYQLDDPSRLVLDFEQVQNGLASRFNDYNIGMVNEVTTLSNDSTTRLIVGLKQSGNYTTAVDGNDLLLTITDPNRPVVMTSPAVTQAPVAARANMNAADNTALTTTAIVTPIVETSSAGVTPIVTNSGTV